MKAIVSIAFFIGLWCIFPQSTHARQQELPNHLLWKISGNELTEPSYLFGTIHIMPKKQFEFPRALKKKVKSADALVTEIPMDLSFSEQMQMASDILLPDNQTLPDLIPDSLYEQYYHLLVHELEIKEKKLARYNKLKPFGAYSAVLLEVIGKSKSYEQELTKQAKRAGIEMLGLETWEFQLGLFDTIPIARQVELFYTEDFREEFYQMTDLYQKQNLQGLYEMIVQNSEFKQIEQELLTKRNKKWVPQLQEWMPEKQLFIAVGAGHLPGPNGLIHLLRKAGYTLEPVPVKW